MLTVAIVSCRSYLPRCISWIGPLTLVDNVGFGIFLALTALPETEEDYCYDQKGCHTPNNPANYGRVITRAG